MKRARERVLERALAGRTGQIGFSGSSSTVVSQGAIRPARNPKPVRDVEELLAARPWLGAP
jgi:hypothetical protein